MSRRRDLPFPRSLFSRHHSLPLHHRRKKLCVFVSLGYIDALDEYDEDQIRNMVLFFGSLGRLVLSGNGNFRVCLASRLFLRATLGKGSNTVLG